MARFVVPPFASLALAVSIASIASIASIGCGGRVGESVPCPPGTIGCEGDLDGGGVDGAVDGYVPPPPPPPLDGGPSGCGFGPCSPGTGCSDGCNECVCTELGWSCTTRACPDGGPPPPPPPPPCPVIQPPAGSTCSIGAKCEWSNGCGGYNYGYCGDGRWTIEVGPCTTVPCPMARPPEGSKCPMSGAECKWPNGCGGTSYGYCTSSNTWAIKSEPCASTCPTSLPIPGTSCSGTSTCDYKNSCGTIDRAVCSSGAWAVKYGDCPPPPPPTCPVTMPSFGSKCSGEGLNCNWNNGCGNVAYGYCSGGTWAIKNPGCVDGCPGTKPGSGTACKKPSSMSCSYLIMPPSSCQSRCFCADDLRWACITEPCAEDKPTPPPSPGM